MPRFTMDDVAKAQPTNQALIDATTDDDIARQIAEDPDTAPDASDRPDDAFVVVDPGTDTRAIRARLALSQEAFAARFGLSVWTVRDWEQRRRAPDGPARVLLKVIAANPDLVAQVVADR
jgi:putative transcriptional regulator